MANTNSASSILKKLHETEVSTVTGTVALAGAAVAAYSIMPSVDPNFANLLQASLVNISSVL